MKKLLCTLDNLSRARDFIKAAYMAALGADLDSEERDAMTRVLAEAEEILESVKANLTEMKNTEGVAADR
jgi:hypothetical protein